MLLFILLMFLGQQILKEKKGLEIQIVEFSDYVVPIVLDLASFLHRVGQESIDLAGSQVARRDGQAVAVALIARRGWTVVPSARGAGVGREWMFLLLDQARVRHDRRPLAAGAPESTWTGPGVPTAARDEGPLSGQNVARAAILPGRAGRALDAGRFYTRLAVAVSDACRVGIS